MKKFLLPLILISGFIKAQSPYYKLLGNTNSEWYIFNAMIPVSQAQKNSATTIAPSVTWGKYTAKTDTLLFSKNYKKFYHVYYFPSSIVNNHIGYLREDTASRKVYFMDKTTFAEDLLYDFSLNVGDSVFMNFPTTSSNFPKGYYKVKSIQNVTIKAGVRKLFKLKYGTSDTLRIIESVGSEIHPVFMYSWGFGWGQFSWGSGSCKYQYDLGLACKYSDNIKEFQSCTYQLALTNGCIFKQDSCNYWNTCSGINELGKVKNFYLSPNPAVSNCTIHIDLEESCSPSVEVYDISGRKMKEISSYKLNAGTNTIDINLSELENGYYLIRIKDEKFNLQQPILVTH